MAGGMGLTDTLYRWACIMSPRSLEPSCPRLGRRPGQHRMLGPGRYGQAYRRFYLPCRLSTCDRACVRLNRARPSPDFSYNTRIVPPGRTATSE